MLKRPHRRVGAQHTHNDGQAVQAELRLMNRLYLASKLAGYELPAAQAGAPPSGGASGS